MLNAAATFFTVGLGLRQTSTAQALHALWQCALGALAAQGVRADAVRTVAVLPHWLHHPALPGWLQGAQLAHARLVAAPPTDLPRQATATQSPCALARHGTGSVAEACALWAAHELAAHKLAAHELAAQAGGGACAQLLRARHVAADGSATLAVAGVFAQSRTTFDASNA